MSLVELIKQMSTEAVKASKPVEVVFGSVLSINPFKVKLDQKLILSDTHLTGDYTPSNYIVGDSVTMLRVQGGKKYCILPSGSGGGSSGGSDFNLDYDSDNEELIVES